MTTSLRKMEALARLYGSEAEIDRRLARRNRSDRSEALLALGLVLLAEVFVLAVIAFSSSA